MHVSPWNGYSCRMIHSEAVVVSLEDVNLAVKSLENKFLC